MITEDLVSAADTAGVLSAIELETGDALPVLVRRYPRLRIQLDVSDRFVDIVHEGFDMAVRSHFRPLPDLAMVQRRVAVEPFVLVAAAAYLVERGEPRRPEDLEGHDGLLLNLSANSWRLQNEGGDVVQVTLNPRMVANEQSSSSCANGWDAESRRPPAR